MGVRVCMYALGESVCMRDSEQARERWRERAFVRTYVVWVWVGVYCTQVCSGALDVVMHRCKRVVMHSTWHALNRAILWTQGPDSWLSRTRSVVLAFLSDSCHVSWLLKHAL